MHAFFQKSALAPSAASTKQPCADTFQSAGGTCVTVRQKDRASRATAKAATNVAPATMRAAQADDCMAAKCKVVATDGWRSSPFFENAISPRWRSELPPALQFALVIGFRRVTEMSLAGARASPYSRLPPSGEGAPPAGHHIHSIFAEHPRARSRYPSEFMNDRFLRR